jgi:hypothetical protein
VLKAEQRDWINKASLVFQLIVQWFEIGEAFVEYYADDGLEVLNGDSSFNRILPACGKYILFVVAFSVLDVLYVDGAAPSLQKLFLLFLIVRVQEYELVGIEQDGVLEGIPTVCFEFAIVFSKNEIVIGLLILLFSL